MTINRVFPSDPHGGLHLRTPMASQVFVGYIYTIEGQGPTNLNKLKRETRELNNN